MPRDTIALLDAPPDIATLAGLAWRLRHPETWPTDFLWNFEDCPTCAMGLLWTELDGEPPQGNLRTQYRTRNFYDLTEGVAFAIFQQPAPGDDYRSVTPEMVADRIDAYLAGAAPCS